MNFGDIQGYVQRNIGYPTSSTIEDQLRQEIKDAINATMDELIAAVQPYLWHHVRQDTISASSSTEIYTLNDRCITPIEFWTEDERARRIPFIDPSEMDWTGLQNSTVTASYTDAITWYPPTDSASKSGAAGATAGISITSGSTAVTKSGGTAWDSTDVGKLLRINNEVDIPISAVGGDNALTLERAYVGRISGTDQDNSPSSLSQVAWEVSPAGRYRVKIPPGPSAGETIYYRYARAHAPLLNSTDIPDLPKNYHMLLVWGACANLSMYGERADSYAMFSGKYAALLGLFRNENNDALGSRTRLKYESSFNRSELYRPEDADWGRRHRRW